jgi:hypothetical protein
MQFKSDVEAIDQFVVKYKELNQEIGKVIVGQEETIKNVLISIFFISFLFVNDTLVLNCTLDFLFFLNLIMVIKIKLAFSTSYYHFIPIILTKNS